MTRSKYNVSKNKLSRTYNGIVFDSELEMRYYRDVVLPKYEDGEITSFELQKEYILQEKFKHNGKTILPIKYIVDFYLVYKDGHVELIDTKGMSTPEALLKRKIFWYNFPAMDYKWICYSKIDGGWCDYDYVKKKRTLRRKQKKQGEK